MISGSNYGTSDETTDTLSSDRYHIMIYMLRGSQFVQFWLLSKETKVQPYLTPIHHW